MGDVPLPLIMGSRLPYKGGATPIRPKSGQMSFVRGPRPLKIPNWLSLESPFQRFCATHRRMGDVRLCLRPMAIKPANATLEEGGRAGTLPSVFRVDRLWEGYHESRRCSRDTYPESYITQYTSIRSLSKSNATNQPPVTTRLHPPSERDQIVFFRPLICTGARHNPATCGANQGN